MRKGTLAAVAIAIMVGSVAATAAAQSGDQAVEGIYLTPANTSNGNAYASLNGDGELVIDVADLNARAVTTIDSAFTISSNQDEEALVWVEPPTSDVTFYRMDTGGSITSRSRAVSLDDGDTITVGMRVDTRGSSPQSGPITVRALLPSANTPQPVRGGGEVGPGVGPTVPETATDGPGTPPTTEPPTDGGPTPTDPGTGTPDATSPTSTQETPEPEVGGFPWLPLLALVLGVVGLPLGFFAYRRYRSSGLRLEVAPDSGLRLEPGSFPAETYDVADGTVTFAFQQSSRWDDRDPERSMAFDDVATLENTADEPREVRGAASGETEGVQVVASAGDRGDLLADPIVLAPNESAPLSLVLPGEYEGRRIAVRCEATNRSPE